MERRGSHSDDDEGRRGHRRNRRGSDQDPETSSHHSRRTSPRSDSDGDPHHSSSGRTKVRKVRRKSPTSRRLVEKVLVENQDVRVTMKALREELAAEKITVKTPKDRRERDRDRDKRVHPEKTPSEIFRLGKSSEKEPTEEELADLMAEVVHKTKHHGQAKGHVIRVRGKHHNIYKFRELDPEDTIEDPLKPNNIMHANTFNDWKREANLTLPSKLGVPVHKHEDVNNIVEHAEATNGESGLRQARKTYQSIYDEVEQRISFDFEDDSSEDSEDGKAKAQKAFAGLRKQLYMLGPQEEHHGADAEAKLQEQKSYYKQLRIIRELAEPMEDKRERKRELLETVGNVSKHKQFSCKDFLSRAATKIHSKWHDFSKLCTLWDDEIRYIHGKFGLAAAYYFQWLRTTVALNVVQSFFVLFLILIPELMYHPEDDTLIDCPINVLAAKTCAIVPHLVQGPYFKLTHGINWHSVFTGVGFVEDTFVYYSGYRDTLADPYCPTYRSKDPPQFSEMINLTAFRFCLVNLLIFFMNAVVVAVKIKHYYHTVALESKVPGLSKTHFKVILSSWDFAVSDPETAQIIHQNIWRSLKDTIHVLDEKAHSHLAHALPARFQRLERSLKKFFGFYTAIAIHTLISLIFITSYFGVGFGLFYTFKGTRERHETSSTDDCGVFEFKRVKYDALPDFMMVVLFLGAGYFCSFLQTFESWESRVVRNLWFMIRVGGFYLLNIFVIFYFFVSDEQNSNRLKQCYEEEIGQELYRLVVFQGLMYFVLSFLSYVIYQRIFLRHSKGFHKFHFDPVNYSMRLFYLNLLSNIGFFYCPIISFLVTLRLLVTFYHHKRMLNTFYAFSTEVIQSSDLQFPFIVGFFVMFVTAAAINVLVLLELHPSSTCGPFSHYSIIFNRTQLGHYSQLFTEVFRDTNSTGSWQTALFSPGTAFVFILCLFCVVYTLREWSLAYFHTINQLLHYLHLERKDRDFLLEAIYHLVKKAKVTEEEAAEETTMDSYNRKHRTSLMSSPMVSSIFKHRKGQMAQELRSSAEQGALDVELSPSEMKLAQASVRKRNRRTDEADKDTHGTVGKYVKNDFQWLPSQWHRRQRRSAKLVDFNEEDLTRFRNMYVQAVLTSQVEDIADYEDEVIHGLDHHHIQSAHDHKNARRSSVKW